MMHIAAKLNYKNLNEEVLKHFARLQSKDEQVRVAVEALHITYYINGYLTWLK